MTGLWKSGNESMDSLKPIYYYHYWYYYYYYYYLVWRKILYFMDLPREYIHVDGRPWRSYYDTEKTKD